MSLRNFVTISSFKDSCHWIQWIQWEDCVEVHQPKRHSFSSCLYLLVPCFVTYSSLFSKNKQFNNLDVLLINSGCTSRSSHEYSVSPRNVHSIGCTAKEQCQWRHGIIKNTCVSGTEQLEWSFTSLSLVFSNPFVGESRLKFCNSVDFVKKVKNKWFETWSVEELKIALDHCWSSTM